MSEKYKCAIATDDEDEDDEEDENSPDFHRNVCEMTGVQAEQMAQEKANYASDRNAAKESE